MRQCQPSSSNLSWDVIILRERKPSQYQYYIRQKAIVVVELSSEIIDLLPNCRYQTKYTSLLLLRYCIQTASAEKISTLVKKISESPIQTDQDGRGSRGSPHWRNNWRSEEENNYCVAMSQSRVHDYQEKFIKVMLTSASRCKLWNEIMKL